MESWVGLEWAIKSKIGSIKCEACGRLIGEHSGDEFEACLRECEVTIECDIGPPVKTISIQSGVPSGT